MNSLAPYSLITDPSLTCQLWNAGNYGVDSLSTSLEVVPATIMVIEMLNLALLFNGHRHLEGAHRWAAARLKIRPSIVATLSYLLPSLSSWGYGRNCGGGIALTSSKWQELIKLGQRDGKNDKVYQELTGGLQELSPSVLKSAACKFLKQAFPPQEAKKIHEGISDEELKIYFKTLIEETRILVV